MYTVTDSIVIDRLTDYPTVDIVDLLGINRVFLPGFQVDYTRGTPLNNPKTKVSKKGVESAACGYGVPPREGEEDVVVVQHSNLIAVKKDS